MALTTASFYNYLHVKNFSCPSVLWTPQRCTILWQVKDMLFGKSVAFLIKQSESHGAVNFLGLPQTSLRKKDLYLGFMKKSAVLTYLNILYALDIKSNFLMRVRVDLINLQLMIEANLINRQTLNNTLNLITDDIFNYSKANCKTV